MGILSRFVSWVDRLSDWSGRIAAWLTFASVLILSYEVVARYVFRAPTRWAHDTSTLLFGALYALTGAYAMRSRSHVGVDVLSSRLRPRTRAALDVVTSVLFFLFVGVFLWQGWRFFMVSFTRREFSLNNQNIPIYPAKFAIPLGAALLLLQGVAKLVQDVHLLVTGRPLTVPSEAQKPAPAARLVEVAPGMSGVGVDPLPALEGEKPR